MGVRFSLSSCVGPVIPPGPHAVCLATRVKRLRRASWLDCQQQQQGKGSKCCTHRITHSTHLCFCYQSPDQDTVCERCELSCERGLEGREPHGRTEAARRASEKGFATRGHDSAQHDPRTTTMSIQQPRNSLTIVQCLLSVPVRSLLLAGCAGAFERGPTAVRANRHFSYGTPRTCYADVEMTHI